MSEEEPPKEPPKAESKPELVAIAESDIQATAEQVAEEIPKHPRLLRAIVQEVKTELHYSGPLPPPDMLVAYNDAFDGCAQQIVGMADRQSRHRQEMEKTDLTASIKLVSRGQNIAAVFGMIALVGGIGLLALGKNIEGFSTLVGAVAVFGGPYVYDRIVRKDEEEDESKTEPKPPESTLPATSE